MTTTPRARARTKSTRTLTNPRQGHDLPFLSTVAFSCSIFAYHRVYYTLAVFGKSCLSAFISLPIRFITAPLFLVFSAVLIPLPSPHPTLHTAQEADEDDGEDDGREDRPKRKALKPPGGRPAKKKTSTKKDAGPSGAGAGAGAGPSSGRARVQRTYAEEDDDDEDEEDGVKPEFDEDEDRKLASMLLERPSLRASTVVRTETAKEVRAAKAKKTKPRAKKEGGPPPLTQGEMLAEAALVEIENMRQLEKVCVCVRAFGEMCRLWN